MQSVEDDVNTWIYQMYEKNLMVVKIDKHYVARWFIHLGTIFLLVSVKVTTNNWALAPRISFCFANILMNTVVVYTP